MRFDAMARSVRAGPSAVHGLGVFAGRALPAGTLASLYPVHSVGVGSQRIHADEDGAYWREPCTTAYRATITHAATPGAPGARPVQEWAAGAYVDANPERPHVDGWLAHLANDAAACSASSEAEILAYYAACEAACNAVMLPLGRAAPVMALVTVCDVPAGQELLLSYGHTYWIEHFGGTAPPATPAVLRAAARIRGDGLEARVARLQADYPSEERLLEGLLAKVIAEAEA